MSHGNGDAPQYSPDILINRITIAGLVVAVQLCILGAIGLAAFHLEVPQMLVSMAGTAIGALASLAVSPRRRNDQRDGH